MSNKPARRANTPPKHRTTVIAERREVFSGPLPSPEMLAQYEEVSPGIGREIVQQWKSQSEHRRLMEATVIPANVAAQRRGQRYALIVALAVLATGGGFMLKGYPTQGAAVIGVDLVALVAVFITGRVKESEEVARKAEADRR